MGRMSGIGEGNSRLSRRSAVLHRDVEGVGFVDALDGLSDLLDGKEEVCYLLVRPLLLYQHYTLQFLDSCLQLWRVGKQLDS
jgi:hypothetical protein